MILVCYDGSASAQHALSVAHETLGSTPTTLLHVWSAPVEILADASFGTRSTSSESLRATIEQLSLERAQAIADEGRARAGGLGLVVDTRIERSNISVWQTILDVASETQADLIVLGTRGATAVQSLLLGSVSNALVHHSQRPVLLVPSETG